MIWKSLFTEVLETYFKQDFQIVGTTKDYFIQYYLL